MNGYKPNYFNKNLLESMKNSLKNVVLGEGYGEPNLGIMGAPGDFSKVSDLQLQNRMRQYKRGGLFAPKDIKQPKEYEEARAELERRQAAKAAPSDVAVPGLRGGLPQMADADIPGMVDQKTGAGFNVRMDQLPSENQAEIMQQTTTGPQAKRTGAAFSVRPERLPYQAKEEVLSASRTPAALRQADASIARAIESGINPNTPGVIPVRSAGSAPAPMPGTQGNNPKPTPIPVNPAALPSDTRAELLRQTDTPAARRRGTNLPPRQTMNPGFSPIGEF